MTFINLVCVWDGWVCVAVYTVFLPDISKGFRFHKLISSSMNILWIFTKNTLNIYDLCRKSAQKTSSDENILNGKVLTSKGANKI